ncbi:MAG: hypothetical protein NC935_00110 [Candidatus Omnitrophica bacterium]|nr:hypothetical protein [Candidatus Omnitrophota bacterium]
MLSIFVQIFGLFFGVLSRTLLPFFRKLYQGKIKHFKIKFFYQAVGAFFLSLIFSFIIFPQYPLQIKTEVDYLAVFKLFCISFAFGFGFNALINEVGEWFKNGKNN